MEKYILLKSVFFPKWLQRSNLSLNIRQDFKMTSLWEAALETNRRCFLQSNVTHNISRSSDPFSTVLSHQTPSVPMVLYGAEAWGMRSAERRKVNVLEMKCLRSLVEVSWMDRVRNEEVHRRAGIERELASWAHQKVLRWFGHVEQMDEYRMARRVLMAEISGGRVRGRQRLGWMDGVKLALGNRLMMVEAA